MPSSAHPATPEVSGWRRRQFLASLPALWAMPTLASLAQDFVVIAHPSAPALTRSAIASIYLGAGGALQPLDLSLPPATRRDIYLALTGFELEHAQAEWARLVFTGRGQPPRMMKRPEDLRGAVANNPRLVGYLPQRQVDDSVKVVLPLA